MKIKFDIDVDSDSLRRILLHGRKAKSGLEDKLEFIASDLSIACGLKATIETVLPQIISMTVEQLTYLLEEVSEEAVSEDGSEKN